MTKRPDKYEDRCTAYLLKEMSPDEAADFEREAQTNSELRDELEATREAIAAAEEWANEEAPGIDRVDDLEIPLLGAAKVIPMRPRLRTIRQLVAVAAVFAFGVFVGRQSETTPAIDTEIASAPEVTWNWFDSSQRLDWNVAEGPEHAAERFENGAAGHGYGAYHEDTRARSGQALGDLMAPEEQLAQGVTANGDVDRFAGSFHSIQPKESESESSTALRFNSRGLGLMGSAGNVDRLGSVADNSATIADGEFDTTKTTLGGVDQDFDHMAIAPVALEDKVETWQRRKEVETTLDEALTLPAVKTLPARRLPKQEHAITRDIALLDAPGYVSEKNGQLIVETELADSSGRAFWVVDGRFSLASFNKNGER